MAARESTPPPGADFAELPLAARVFAKLADGQFHSGETLAAELVVSRSAVWKAAKALRDLGATIHAVRNRGYRLATAAEPLDSARIQDLLTPEARQRVKRLDTAWSVGSTNTILMERAHPPAGSSEVMLSEYQSAGRGRRGRVWLAPPGGSICLSLSWTFPDVPRDLGALGLAIGVCALRALTSLGVEKVQLKWPNDLLIADRKLGGILIELRAESGGPAYVVIGIGLNVALGAGLLEKMAQSGLAPIDLVCAGLGANRLTKLPGDGHGQMPQTMRGEPLRNAVAARLVNSFVEGLLGFERDGLKPFVQEWVEADALRGRTVTVQAAVGPAVGVARGIDLDGSLLVETPLGLRRFVSGDVSVRATS
jgi:BirA family transcriptional regulator, biotin operon repressor / biotin---[acetyl-CoA-carboxylase] ligase